MATATRLWQSEFSSIDTTGMLRSSAFARLRDPTRSAADEEVLEFLSIKKDLPGVEKWARFTSASDQFYRELGINPLLPEYGQIGRYEPLYKSYKYGGFIYRKEGEWHPERHPDYQDVYEVKYP